MQKADFVRLSHMLDATKDAIAFVKNETRASLNTDRKLVLALMKSIEIIGEAVAKTSIELQESIQEIPWPDIISMRNRLIHAYFDINLDILWQTVVEDLPNSVIKLERLIKTKPDR